MALAERVRLPHLFTPRDYQVPFLASFPHQRRYAAWVVHRRGGKDLTAFSAVMVPEAAETVGTYYYFLPTISHARKVIWDGMDNEGVPFLARIPRRLLAGKPNESTMRIELVNGSAIQLLGSDNYDSIVGTNPRGVIFSEYAVGNPRGWDYIRPIIRGNQGWAGFLYTPRGANHGLDLLDVARDNPGEWFSEVLTVADTGVFSPADIDAERRSGMSEELIQQEYYCDFESGNVGSYYGRLLADASAAGRIGGVSYEPGLPVHTRWDLGVGDATAIWCWQDVGRERRFVNFYEASGEGLPHYVAWLQRTGYVFGRHYAPHDIAVREFSSGVSRLDTARNLGIRFEVVPLHSLEDGIEAVRQELPRCWFDKERCKDGIAALRDYHKDYDEQHQVFRTRPAHTWSSHASDAFRTGSMGHREAPAAIPPPDPYVAGYRR